MFIDEIEIVVQGGKGGDGIVSFFPGKNGPDGGNGGDGGDVYARVNTNLSNLNKYAEKRFFQAGDGMQGEHHRRTGLDGKDLTLDLPVGTTLIDVDTGEEIELLDWNIEVLVCRGGKGGLGNDAFKSATNQVPKEFKPGEEGQKRLLKLVLRLIADFGLIGLPNAGKSSLLNELTAAHVRTAPYPFTTLEPNLGVLNGKIIADIPGLIEGASQGKGLGTKFLKHIEKVNLLLHCIASDSNDVLRDYQTIRKELGTYNPQLLSKKEVILLTKSDLLNPEKIKEKVKTLKELGKEVFPISIHDWDALENCKELLK